MNFVGSYLSGDMRKIRPGANKIWIGLSKSLRYFSLSASISGLQIILLTVMRLKGCFSFELIPIQIASLVLAKVHFILIIFYESRVHGQHKASRRELG